VHSSLGAGAACATFGVALIRVWTCSLPDERQRLAARLVQEGLLPCSTTGCSREADPRPRTMGPQLWSAIGLRRRSRRDRDPRRGAARARLGRARGRRRDRVGALRRQRARAQARDVRPSGGFYEASTTRTTPSAAGCRGGSQWRDAFRRAATRPRAERIAEFSSTRATASAGAPWSLDFGDGALTANGAGLGHAALDLATARPRRCGISTNSAAASERQRRDGRGACCAASRARLRRLAPTDAEIANPRRFAAQQAAAAHLFVLSEAGELVEIPQRRGGAVAEVQSSVTEPAPLAVSAPSPKSSATAHRRFAGSSCG